MKPGAFLIVATTVALLSSAFDNNRKPEPDRPDPLFKGAAWITDAAELPTADSLFYGDHPAPLLRTGFTIRGEIKKAEMFITAAGYYEAWLNGSRVGDQQLDPAWTDFNKRIYVSALDVTTLVKPGENAWGILLGNGFYNPLPLRMWGARNLRNDMPVGKPCAIASLVVTLVDGSRQTITTSDQWVSRPGPVTRNNVYLGEWYDARREVGDWALPGISLSGWEPVKIVGGPGGKPELSSFPPIRITRWLNPIAIDYQGESNQIIDFGQNLAGVIQVKIQAGKGDTIRFRYGELLYPDGSLNPMTAVCGQIKRAGVGGPGAPAIAWQMDVYVAKGEQPELFQPRFTFHGFRYVEINGLKEKLKETDIRAWMMNTDVTGAARIVSSSDYLNRLNETCRWTFLSNLQGVQSDCPAREKFGYGGDINATIEAYLYNYDMQGIYRKIIYDWIDAMKPDGFVDTAPFVGIEYCGLSWESAFLFLQEALWIHYGDTELVKDLYETDQAWMEKVARLHPNLIVDNGLSDHESLEKVPVELTGTCHYYQIARIMARFAAVNGDPDGVASYSALAERIRLKIIDLFWDQPAITVPNQQTLLATLLACGVLDEPDRRLAMGRLLDVLQQADYHVTTGIFGTRFLLEALSSNGRTDIAFRLVNQPGFPGWKYMIDNGATTIWETWKESDNTFSQNHPMFGSVSGWYLKWLGGIQPDSDNPAPDAVILKPRPVRELNSVTVEKYFPAGTVRSGWRWEQGTLLLEFDIPPGLTTTWIPEETSRSVVVRQSPDGWNISQSSDKLRINLSKPGRYAFAIQRSE